MFAHLENSLFNKVLLYNFTLYFLSYAKAERVRTVKQNIYRQVKKSKCKETRRSSSKQIKRKVEGYYATGRMRSINQHTAGITCTQNGRLLMFAKISSVNRDCWRREGLHQYATCLACTTGSPRSHETP